MSEKTNIRWTTDKIMLEAKKYSTKIAFKKGNNKAYQAACRYGIDIFCHHMDNSKLKLSDEKLKEIALKYSTLTEFRKNDNKAYNYAYTKGILKPITTHMISGGFKKSNKELHDIALKYTERNKFAKGNPREYSAATYRNILDEICSHMVDGKIKYTDNKLKEIALLYKTKIEFMQKNYNAYNSAWHRGILNNICEHMTSSGYGYNIKSSAILYYIKLESIFDTPIYKIGVTNKRTEDRIKSMQINKNFNASILKEIYFENGNEAIALEKLLHKEFKEFQYTGEKIMKTGNKELFTKNVLKGFFNDC